MTVVPLDIGRALYSPDPARREAAEAALVRSLERRARDHGVEIGNEMTLVDPDHALRVHVLLRESGSETIVFEGDRLQVHILRRAAQGSAQETTKKTKEGGDWRTFIDMDEWHRLNGVSCRLPPAFRPMIAQPGVTSQQGSSLLPPPGRRQDRRRLEPVIASRLQRLWQFVRGNGGVVSYVENDLVGVCYHPTPHGIHFRILRRSDAALMLTGVLDSPDQGGKGLLDIRTWKKGFEEEFLSNQPWALSVYEGAVVAKLRNGTPVAML